ncbi:MAG: hypothetical protein H6613_11310 [Ignavibacteriales bacterium]|nr:hypothetical protein [Ignavibacteriales bacterium]
MMEQMNFHASNCVMRQGTNSTQSVTIPNGTSIPANNWFLEFDSQRCR